jgi:hypothetical protein
MKKPSPKPQMTNPPSSEEEIMELIAGLQKWLDASKSRQFYLPVLRENVDACFDWAWDKGVQSANWQARLRNWIRRDIEWMDPMRRKAIAAENKVLRARLQQQRPLLLEDDGVVGKEPKRKPGEVFSLNKRDM